MTRGVPRDGKVYGDLRDTQGWGDLRAFFRAYVRSDSCPDNTFLAPGRLRLIDFERGRDHLCLLYVAHCRRTTAGLAER